MRENNFSNYRSHKPSRFVLSHDITHWRANQPDKRENLRNLESSVAETEMKHFKYLSFANERIKKVWVAKIRICSRLFAETQNNHWFRNEFKRFVKLRHFRWIFRWFSIESIRKSNQSWILKVDVLWYISFECELFSEILFNHINTKIKTLYCVLSKIRYGLILIFYSKSC